LRFIFDLTFFDLYFWIGARVVAVLSTTDQMQMKIRGGVGLQNFNVWPPGDPGERNFLSLGGLVWIGKL
jgi:hypothetical protein